MGPSTAHHVHATFSSALTAAVRRGRLRANVAKAVPPPRRAERADPKTRASARTLSPLPSVVIDAFRRLEPGRGDQLVWPAVKRGGPMGAAAAARAWYRIRKRSGLPPAKFHNLRHTAATIMLDDGAPPHVVSALLGHASVGITLQLYAHVTRTGLGAASAALDSRYATAS